MENKKMSIKEITFGVVFIALFMLAGLLWINVGEAKEEYKPLTPQAQTVYDQTLATLKSAELAHKSSECSLVDAKLMDYANDYEKYPLTQKQVASLSAKRESCKNGFQ